ncbi:MAG: membrane protein insertion efficiency factor YidD [Ruminococcus sp.]|nr:membrane protein insertion efficiency factor YidD [Ruminococcus sp.]
MRRLYLFPVILYRRFISPLKPPCCRFTPTCSAYTITAIERFGIIKGTVLALWRILRCNPFCKGGIDPVPEKFSFFDEKRKNGGDNT